MESPLANTEEFVPPGPIVRWLMRLLSLAGAGLASYLLWVWWLDLDAPAGCGAGSGCAEVLNSRWSLVLGIPVSAAALSVYLSALLATGFIASRSPPAMQRIAWTCLVLLAFVILLAAGWFMLLQYYVVDAICPWCMVEHSIGVLLAGTVFWCMPRDKSILSESGMPVHLVWGRRKLLLAAMGAVSGLVGVQIAVPSSGREQGAKRLAEGESIDTGPGTDRRISVLNGELQLTIHDEPLVGSPDARRIVVLMFDYCCPHCRDTHRFLTEAREKFPDQFAVLALPTPLDSDCNSNVTKTETGFEHACDLARLALAVWRADPDRFAQFDGWLFDSSEQRTPAEARVEAERLVTSQALSTSETESMIEERIRRNISAYTESAAKRIPVILSPDMKSIVGRPTREQLFEILRDDLGLQEQE